MAKKEKRQRRGRRQEWRPNPLTWLLYTIWRIGATALKIVAGTVATVLLIVIVCGFVVVTILGDYLQDDIMPMAEMNLDDYILDKTSYVYCYDDKGNVQILQQIHSTTDRQWVSFEDLPEDLLHAAVAIEDKRFYEHQGVDWITTAKACINMFFGGSSQFGGSTLTQQLVKNLELMVDESADDVTVQRKILEIFRAQAFEKTYDKEVVMEWYMNTVFFGEGCYGVKSAAENYFGKELQDMTTAELASLIGITNNPSLFNPYRTWRDNKDMNGAQRNRDRQLTILGELLVQEWITREEYDEAKSQLLVFKRGIDDADRWTECVDILDKDGNVLFEGCGYKGPVRDLVAQTTGDKTLHYCPECGIEIDTTTDASQAVYSWYVDTVLEDVARDLAIKDGVTAWNRSVRERYINKISRSGYHIYTAYNAAAQEAVDKVYTDVDNIPTTLGSQQLQSAIVVIDNRTGDIIAMSGGVGEKEIADAWNRAVDAQRQPGSSIKPLTVYAQAFERGIITPATIIDDLPLMYENGVAFPRNDSKTYAAQRTVWRGIVSSINSVAVNTLDKVGLSSSFDFAKNKLGLSTLVERYTNSAGTVFSDIAYSPLGMGAMTYGVTVRDMTNAYATFANHGTYREARTYYGVLDDNGNVILDNDQDSRKLFGEKAINYLNYCLTDAVYQGTGTAASLFSDMGISTAGKTGSTQANKDRYFSGFTGYYTAAVWCGFDTPEQIYLTGDTTNPACRLWKRVMLQLHDGKDNIPLYDTSEMVEVTLCLESGLLATEACSHDVRNLGRTFDMQLYPEDVPTTFCNLHVSLDYCVDGVAGEYCHKFQNVGVISFSQKSLVKLTQARIDRLMLAKTKGLSAEYTKNNYVYLVDENGNPIPFFGMDPKKPINEGLEVPYQVCTKHTQEAWEQYVAEHPWLDDTPDEPEVPVEPEVPDVPTDPSQPADPTLPTDPALPVDPTQNTNTED
jgi:penicillin-binding protein 1A